MGSSNASAEGTPEASPSMSELHKTLSNVGDYEHLIDCKINNSFSLSAVKALVVVACCAPPLAHGLCVA